MTRVQVPGKDRERGLLSTEMALMMPILVFIALFAVYVAAVGRHSSRAQQSADAAARAASLEQTEPDARAAAEAAAGSVCSGTVVVSGFVFDPPDLNSFTPGRAAVALQCTEDFQAFGFLGANSTRTEGASAVAVIEYWRTTPP